MNEMKQPAQNREDGVTRISFWGTIALSALFGPVSAYFLTVLLKQSPTLITYIGMSIFIGGIIITVISLILTLRGEQSLGIRMIFYTVSILGVMIIGIFQGRAQTASFTILLLLVIMVRWLLPSQLRRSHLWIAVAVFSMMWVIEWLNPSWRVKLDVAPVGPIATVIFALLLGWMLFTQSRRFLASSLRYKLVAAFIGISVFAIAGVGITSSIITTRQLDNVLGQDFSDLAARMGKETGNEIVRSKIALDGLALNKFVQDTIEEANQNGTSDSSRLSALDQQWVSAADSDPIITGVLGNELAGELLELQGRLPQYAELFVTDQYGAVIASTDRTSDYFQADEEWWQSAWNRGQGRVYISQPVFDESADIYAIDMALPVPAHNGTQIVGILRATIDMNELTNVLSADELGKTGQALLVFPSNQYITGEAGTELDTLDTDIVSQLQNLQTSSDTLSFNGTESLVSKAPVYTSSQLNQDIVDQLGWTVIVHQSLSEAHAPIAATTRGVLFVAFGILITAGLVAFYLGTQFTRPLESLTSTAEKLAQGDLSAEAPEESQDEIGLLARTFNNMGRQLTDLIASLEKRVADRTRNLELAAEVGRSVSQVRALDSMLKDAAELIRSQFDLYYVQVYLTDPNQTNLLLLSGTGNVGEQLVNRGHRLPLNTGSINGRAAIEKKPVVIADTAASATFRPNPLLPNTRSEMAIPLVVGQNVVGVLDLQSEKANALSQELLPAFEALAGQLAIAIQNANLLAETEQARAEVETQARRLVRANWTDYMDAIHKPETTGFVFEQNKVMPLAQTVETQSAETSNSLTVPIQVTGEAVGNLVVEIDQTTNAKNDELVHIVARQVAQHIEELRLLESAERYRYEAEQTTRLQTVEGWQKYLESRTAEQLGYFYDTTEVRPQQAGLREDTAMFALPIKARDESIGKLGIQGLTDKDQESIELVSAVAERLSAHIENLRLLEETKRGQIELTKRALELQAVAEISTQASVATNTQEMLQSMVDLTKESFHLYHTHIYLLSKDGSRLVLTAGAGDVGRQMVAENRQILIDQPHSLVARAARTRQGIISNDVTQEPDFLPNPLLPNTRSEMAIPITVGDALLGVFDVQGDVINRFTDEDIAIKTTLSRQIAVALQNLQNFAKAQQQAERESRLNMISQKIQSATTVEAVLQIAARELGHTLGAPLTIAQLGLKDKQNGN